MSGNLEPKVLTHEQKRALTAVSASGAGGLTGFYVGFVSTHALALILRATASSVKGNVLGTVGLVASSISAGVVASWAKDSVLKAYSPPRSRGVIDWDGFCTNARIIPSVEKVFGNKQKDQILSGSLLLASGSAIFCVLGGRLRSFALSRYDFPGAFAKPRKALPTGTDYADSREKARIASLGRRYGCHTCGSKHASQYIADHMPPNKIAKEANKRWLRRTFNWPMKQHFYPQCSDCSTTQSHVVRLGMSLNKAPIKSHFFQLRLYHFTGLLLGPLFTEGIQPNVDEVWALIETMRLFFLSLLAKH